MTTIDPFTTPAEAEREGRVKQAQNLLDEAQGASTRTLNYDGGAVQHELSVAALRDALVGQGHATLAVNANLDRIATALETLAAMPSAIARVAESLTELGVDVRELHTAIEGCYEATTSGSIDIAAAVRETGEMVGDALDNVAEVIDRVRWWQLRRRWTMRQHRKALALYAGRDAVSDPEADVYNYRVELRCPGKRVEPSVSEMFLAKPATACDVAREWLPLLCERAHIPADPDEVYGQVFLVLQDGTAIGLLDAVFLPGATVLLPDAPEGF